MPDCRQDENLRVKVAALLTAATVLSGCAALTGDTSTGLTGLATGDTAARGGGAVVTVDALEAEVETSVAAGALEAQQFTGSELERRVQLQTLVLNNLFQIELATAAAADQFGIEVTEADVDELVDAAAEEAGGIEALEVQLVSAGQSLELFRRNQAVLSLRQQITEALLEQEPLTDEDVQAEYEARANEFEQVSASHILVPTEDEALAAIERIESGEDFADVAAELSQDPGSAQAGGSLGLAPRGSFVPPFEAAIWDGPAPEGELLGPVETQFGWHVIRVDEFVVTPEDEALEQVRDELESGRGADLFGFWFRQVRSDADVEVAGRFGRWDPTSQSIVRDDTPAPQQ